MAEAHRALRTAETIKTVNPCSRGIDRPTCACRPMLGTCVTTATEWVTW